MTGLLIGERTTQIVDLPGFGLLRRKPKISRPKDCHATEPLRAGGLGSAPDGLCDVEVLETICNIGRTRSYARGSLGESESELAFFANRSEVEASVAKLRAAADEAWPP
jgi:hypothetical protein